MCHCSAHCTWVAYCCDPVQCRLIVLSANIACLDNCVIEVKLFSRMHCNPEHFRAIRESTTVSCCWIRREPVNLWARVCVMSFCTDVQITQIVVQCSPPARSIQAAAKWHRVLPVVPAHLTQATSCCEKEQLWKISNLIISKLARVHVWKCLEITRWSYDSFVERIF